MSMRDIDLLEELELWPQWHLRRDLTAPVIKHHVNAPETVESLSDTPQPVISSPKTAELSRDVEQTQFRLLVNQDASMLFVCDQALSPTMQTMLDNILKAINFSAQQTMMNSDIKQLDDFQNAVVLVMGMSLGQTILNQKFDMSKLPQKVHAQENRQIIITYALSDLVSQPEHKARCWQDLCLAKLTTEHLKSQN